jgi:hypothetical protein
MFANYLAMDGKEDLRKEVTQPSLATVRAAVRNLDGIDYSELSIMRQEKSELLASMMIRCGAANYEGNGNRPRGLQRFFLCNATLDGGATWVLLTNKEKKDDSTTKLWVAYEGCVAEYPDQWLTGFDVAKKSAVAFAADGALAEIEEMAWE